MYHIIKKDGKGTIESITEIGEEKNSLTIKQNFKGEVSLEAKVYQDDNKNSEELMRDRIKRGREIVKDMQDGKL